MSRLGNLFGMSAGDDSNDSLKYSAPKEPKKGNASAAASTASPVKTEQPTAQQSTGIKSQKFHKYA